jgi:transposase-like protein
MQYAEMIPNRDALVHPNCPDCGLEMILIAIEGYTPDHDRRMFKCLDCGIEFIDLAKYN